MKRATAAGLACVMLVVAASASAAELQWGGRPFTMIASEKSLPDFLRELAASQNTTAVIDPKVAGSISGRFEIGRDASAARKVLDDVTKNYGLTWYYDGSLLYIEPASDSREELIAVSPGSGARVRASLLRMHVADRRFTLQISPADGGVLVAGPSHYVDAVRRIVGSVNTGLRGRDRSQVRVFPLKYAWANDFEIRRASGAGTTVPGVASVLRSLYDPRYAAMRGASGRSVLGAVQMPRVSSRRSMNLPSGGTALTPRLDLPGEGADTDAASLGDVSRDDLPQIQADSRLNAVIVRDLPERMADYAKLIETLDARPRLVEIEVAIMDITNESLTRLGIDWRAHTSRFDLQTGNGGSPALSWNSMATAAGQTGSTAPVGGVFSAAIGSELRRFLLARVNALATDGQANFVARPKVLTLDNTEASIENKSEFYVRVAGFQDASLYTVQAGTEVRVVPLLIDDRGTRQVLLNMNIVDDSVGTDMVDNVPIVKRRSVVAQAIVEEGKSVLLAGYSSEERLNGSSGVPGLSKLPVVGALFRTDERRRTNVERLYMLTPRYVLPDGSTSRPSIQDDDAPATAPAIPPAMPPAAAPTGNTSNTGKPRGGAALDDEQWWRR